MSKKDKETEIMDTAVVDDTVSEDSPKKKKNFKRLKYGSMSAAVIALVIAIVVVANIMCGLLMKRYPIKLDITPDNRYEITDQSKDVLAEMNKDVEVTVTSTKDYFTQLSNYYKNMYYQYYGVIVDCPYDIIPEMLDKYSVYAEAGKGSVKIKFVDINKNPDVVSEISKVYSGEIQEGSLVFRCGDRVKVLGPDAVASMVAPSQDSSASSIKMTFAGESAITSAIRSVTDMNPVRAAVITSMNGNGIFDQTHSYIVSSVRSFLSTNGYDCTDVDVATDSLNPEDYELLVVVAPAVDFSQDQVAKFADFLYNDGQYQRNMIYVPNFYATNLPNINEFLAEWKISVDQAYICDDNKSIQATIAALNNIDYAPIVNVASTDAVGTLANEALPIAAPGTRPITVLDVNNDSIVTEVLKSSDSSYLSQLVQDVEVSSEQKSYNVVVKSRKEVGADFAVYGSELLVVGSPFMLDSAVLSSTNTFNNANAMLSIVNNMTGKEASVIIPDKSIQQSNLSLTSTSAGVIQIIVIIVIPLLIAIAGAAVLIWRKNK